MRRRLSLLVLAALVLGGCAGRTPSLRSMSEDRKRQSLLALQVSDLRVAAIAFRLAAAGNEICPARSPLVGMTLHDPAQYAPELRGSLGLRDGVSVLAVVPGGPADKAGLRAGDTLRAVGAATLSSMGARKRATYANVAAAYRALDEAARAGSISLQVERNGVTGPTAIAPVSGCASRVQLIPSQRMEARADGINLSVTTAMIEYARSDDEVALVIAHEMAHNALGHRALLELQRVKRDVFESYGASANKVRETEQAADRLGYYLLARAGFDLAAAPIFWRRLYNGPAADGRPPTTHPDGAERIAQAATIASEIASKRREGRPIVP